MTPSDFFTGLEAAGALETREGVAGRYRFDIDGPKGGCWVVDFDRRTVTAGEGPADALIRAAERDFLSWLSGYLSLADALLTDRLQVNGDVAALLRVAEHLQQVVQPKEKNE